MDLMFPQGVFGFLLPFSWKNMTAFSMFLFPCSYETKNIFAQ